MSKDPRPQGEGAHGEGNYEATRDYNARTKRFIDSGKVAEAAAEAAPRSAAEEAEMREAEAKGKSRASRARVGQRKKIRRCGRKESRGCSRPDDDPQPAARF